MPGVSLPTTRYTKSGDVHLAYQVVGEGAFDLVYVPGFVSNIEEAWRTLTIGGFWRGWRRFLDCCFLTSEALASLTPSRSRTFRRWSSGWTISVR